MNIKDKIKKLDAYKYFEDPIKDLVNINFTPEEIFDFFNVSIQNENWLRTTKCISWIMENPHSLFIEPLCKLLRDSHKKFHPEEVINALEDIIEIDKSVESLSIVIEALKVVSLVFFESDPNHNINIKCIHNLCCIAEMNEAVYLFALEVLIDASSCDIDEIKNEAKECIAFLSERHK